MMEVIHAQVFDPEHEGYPDEETRIEILVTGLQIHEPTHTMHCSEWTIFQYGEVFINFAHRFEDEWKVEEFNISGETEFAVFPVTVSPDGKYWRDLYAPVPWVRLILSEHSDLKPPKFSRGKWVLEVDDERALRGWVDYRLRMDKSVSPSPMPEPVIVEGEVV